METFAIIIICTFFGPGLAIILIAKMLIIRWLFGGSEEELAMKANGWVAEGAAREQGYSTLYV
jgi:hypothetical protein